MIEAILQRVDVNDKISRVYYHNEGVMDGGRGKRGDKVNFGARDVYRYSDEVYVIHFEAIFVGRSILPKIQDSPRSKVVCIYTVLRFISMYSGAGTASLRGKAFITVE